MLSFPILGPIKYTSDLPFPRLWMVYKLSVLRWLRILLIRDVMFSDSDTTNSAAFERPAGFSRSSAMAFSVPLSTGLDLRILAADVALLIISAILAFSALLI